MKSKLSKSIGPAIGILSTVGIIGVTLAMPTQDAVSEDNTEVTKQLVEEVKELNITVKEVQKKVEEEPVVQFEKETVTEPIVIAQEPPIIPEPEVIVVQEPLPEPKPEPMPEESKAETKIFNPIPSKGYNPNKEYVASEEIKDESNYVELGFLITGYNGEYIEDAVVQITATDESQNRTLNGTGNVTKVYDSEGNAKTVPFYPFHYQFKEAGEHTITFTVDNKSEKVTISVVDAS